MVYVLKKNFPSELKVRQGLSQVYGIGIFTCNQLCDQLGINSKLTMDQLRRSQIEKINRLVSSYYLTDYELKKQKGENIQRLITIGTYRGFRHVNRLPLRGQRTKTNAKTTKRLGKKILAKT